MPEPLSTLELTKGVTQVYLRAEYALLDKLASALSAGIDSDGWEARKIAQLAIVQRDLEAIMVQASKDVQDPLIASITAGWDDGSKRGRSEAAELLDELIELAPAGPTVQTLVTATYGAVTQTHVQVVRSVADVYRRVIGEATSPLITGVYTRREATQHALNRFADAGVKGFTDRAGRRWDLASYAEMATRTQVVQASVEGHVQSLQKAGGELVRVTDHSGECPLCRPFEGKVFRMGMAGSTQYPLLSSATDAGLFHPGCRHTTALYIHGVSKPIKGPGTGPDPAGYAARQRQREMERNIRKWKRREAVAITDAEKAYTRKQRIQSGRRLTQHVQENGLKRLRYREVTPKAIGGLR